MRTLLFEPTSSRLTSLIHLSPSFRVVVQKSARLSEPSPRYHFASCRLGTARFPGLRLARRLVCPSRRPFSRFEPQGREAVGALAARHVCRGLIPLVVRRRLARRARASDHRRVKRCASLRAVTAMVFRLSVWACERAAQNPADASAAGYHNPASR